VEREFPVEWEEGRFRMHPLRPIAAQKHFRTRCLAISSRSKMTRKSGSFTTQLWVEFAINQLLRCSNCDDLCKHLCVPRCASQWHGYGHVPVIPVLECLQGDIHFSDFCMPWRSVDAAGTGIILPGRPVS
jgi:hypothetical protein